MDLSVINNIASFEGIRDEWNALLSRSENDTLYLRHEWLSNWYKANGEKSELLVVLVRNNGELTGAAPMIAKKNKRFGLPVKEVTFINDTNWTMGDFILAGKKEQVCKKILDSLLSLERDVISLCGMPEGSESLKIITRGLEEKKIKHIVTNSSSHPFLKADTPWDAFYKSRSVRFKKSIRNKLNRIKKAGEVEVRRYATAREVTEMLPVIFDIGLKGWKHKINNAISSTEESKAFYTSLCAAMGPLGLINIWVLYLDGNPVAFEYHVRHGNKIYGLVADFMEEHRDLSPGSVLDYHIMEHIFKNDKCVYNMGSGNSFYKGNWTEESLKTVNFSIFRNSLYCSALLAIENRIAPQIKLLKKIIKPSQADTLNRGAAS